MSRARRRDRRVYLASHPVLFALLAATRHRPVVRLGRTVLVHDPVIFRSVLTSVPLDRTATGTTGGEAARLAGAGTLFDQDGDAHRRARRDAADRLGTAGVERLRPRWNAVLDRRLAALGAGGEVDLVSVAAEMAGVTAAALLDVAIDPLELASAARAAAAATAREHLPGLGRRLGSARRRFGGAESSRAVGAADRLTALVGPGLPAVFAVAAINTTVAALPRAAAWAADAGLWTAAAELPQALADELLRVTAATPLLPRVPAAAVTLSRSGSVEARPELSDPSVLLGPTQCPGGGGPGSAVDGHAKLSDRSGSLGPTQSRGGGWPVGPGDRLLLITRHAAGAHRRDPDPHRPVPPQPSRLIFGAGPHTCPGAALARAQMADFLATLAAYRPQVLRRRVDRHAALPGWRLLTVRAGS